MLTLSVSGVTLKTAQTATCSLNAAVQAPPRFTLDRVRALSNAGAALFPESRRVLGRVAPDGFLGQATLAAIRNRGSLIAPTVRKLISVESYCRVSDRTPRECRTIP